MRESLLKAPARVGDSTVGPRVTEVHQLNSGVIFN
jgi:hypothetical protein